MAVNFLPLAHGAYDKESPQWMTFICVVTVVDGDNRPPTASRNVVAWLEEVENDSSD